MEGKREEIRKGPWKAEEDEVLINHVKKYGPRDWSSIRSKGLLQRTGKSCRLRWVNKLRPNLKNGCKFSLEEERVVIELQAQFGNKWARIATHLPGRTDNDVKNFWSSRQKRLARILQNSATPSSSSNNFKSHKPNRNFPILEAPKLSTLMEAESSSKTQSCSSSNIDNAERINQVNPNSLERFIPSDDHHQTNNNNPSAESHLPISFPKMPQTQKDITFSPESQELLARLEDPYFFDVFGPVDAPELLHVGTPLTIVTSGRRSTLGKDGNDHNPVNPDSFFDDFPADMFDHIEPLPSPSDW